MSLFLTKTANLILSSILLMSCSSAKQFNDNYANYSSAIIKAGFVADLSWTCANGWGIATRDKNWILSISFISESGEYHNLDYKVNLPSENHFVGIHDLRMVGDKDLVISEEASFDRIVYEGSEEKRYSAVKGTLEIRTNSDGSDAKAILSNVKFVVDSGDVILIDKAYLEGSFWNCEKIGK